jgi:hypothetical protein
VDFIVLMEHASSILRVDVRQLAYNIEVRRKKQIMDDRSGQLKL